MEPATDIDSKSNNPNPSDSFNTYSISSASVTHFDPLLGNTTPTDLFTTYVSTLSDVDRISLALETPLPPSPPSRRLTGHGQPPRQQGSSLINSGSRSTSRTAPEGWVSTIPKNHPDLYRVDGESGESGGVRLGHSAGEEVGVTGKSIVGMFGRKVSETMVYATGGKLFKDDNGDNGDNDGDGKIDNYEKKIKSKSLQSTHTDTDTDTDTGPITNTFANSIPVACNRDGEFEDEWVNFVKTQLGKLFPDFHLSDDGDGLAVSDGEMKVRDGKEHVMFGNDDAKSHGQDVKDQDNEEKAQVSSFRAELVSMREEIGRLRDVITSLTEDLRPNVPEITPVDAEVINQTIEDKASGEDKDKSQMNHEVVKNDRVSKKEHDDTISTKQIELLSSDRDIPKAFIETAHISVKLIRALDQFIRKKLNKDEQAKGVHEKKQGDQGRQEEQEVGEDVDTDNVFKVSNLELLIKWLKDDLGSINVA